MNHKYAYGALIIFAAGLAHAATDQTILGKSLTVRNPSTAARRKITGRAKEENSPNTIVGNPTVSGGSLLVTVGGGTPSSQAFVLPQNTSAITGKPFWSGDAVKGFKYKDTKGEQSAVRSVAIKKAPNGRFSIKAVVSGKIGPLLVTPPDPGTNGCVALTISGGDSYSVAFKAGDGVVINKGATLYKHKKVAMEGSCFAPTTTSTSTTTTSSSSSSTTTLYGSPSKAFLERVLGLLD